MTLLSMKGVRLSLEGTTILNDLALSVPAGKIVGLVGESGSGKSMTALSILQLLPEKACLSGSVMFDGQELMSLNDTSLQKIRGNRIGMIFQEPMTALNPLQTIGHQIQEVFRIHMKLPRSEMERRTRMILERVGLSPGRDFALRFPHGLSGGQRQRAMIAMALALRPKLVIADEPTTALDVTTQEQILRLLKMLVVHEKASLLLVTHDLGVVASMADSIAVMRQGKIIEHRQTKDFFTKPTHYHSQSLIKAYLLPVKANPVAGHKVRRTNTDDILLEAAEVSRCYRGETRALFGFGQKIQAVSQVSFKIRAGESIGLVGESGCGKSTLSRMLLGLDYPSSGSILFKGKNIRSFSSQEMTDFRRQVQIVFQDPAGSFNPRLKCGYSVAEPLRLMKGQISKADWDARILQSFIEVGLHAEDAEKYPHEFSGGQRQRLSIARALIVRPALIVLDEPVSALDGTIRAQIMELLIYLRERRGLAYLFISHDLSVVRSITEKVMVMRKGQIIEEGFTEEVLVHPKKSYTRELVSASPNLEKIMAQMSS